MAKTFLTNSAGDGSRASQRSKIVDVCNLIAELQQGQFQLVSQMENLVLAQKQLLLAQEQSEQRVATLVEELREQRQAAGRGTVMPDPALRFDAGSRLTGTFELLEMLLRELPNETVLIFQRVNNQFKSIVAESCPLQHKLFYETGPLALSPTNLILNPVLTKGSPTATELDVNACIASEWQCQERETWDKRGSTWTLPKADSILSFYVYLSEKESGRGKKRMYITQPSCDVMLRATIKEGKTPTCHTYVGSVTGKRTLDDLLEGLARAKLVEK
ncbi:hypothetical protein LTR17_024555 [Elasticomyces elasticus]|nr:hypothetical protein LTR17_024555 [Elasticomyces elasticus]